MGLIENKSTIKKLVGRMGLLVAGVVYNNAKLSVSIESDKRVGILDCEVAVRRLQSSLDLSLLLFNGVEVSSTEHNRKAHTAYRNECAGTDPHPNISAHQEQKEKMVGVLRLKVAFAGWKVLQLFSVGKLSVVFSNPTSKSNLKLQES
ncbi:hypothetical protein TPPAVE_211 [Candidatus Tremblaya phenacola PAVE]|nr:hypothetical protein TPPAVE_211 [Candidatus Tremblaya phenacola PAVE]